jgi:hypothetical protein
MSTQDVFIKENVDVVPASGCTEKNKLMTSLGQDMSISCGKGLRGKPRLFVYKKKEYCCPRLDCSLICDKSDECQSFTADVTTVAGAASAGAAGAAAIADGVSAAGDDASGGTSEPEIGAPSGSAEEEEEAASSPTGDDDGPVEEEEAASGGASGPDPPLVRPPRGMCMPAKSIPTSSFLIGKPKCGGGGNGGSLGASGASESTGSTSTGSSGGEEDSAATDISTDDDDKEDSEDEGATDGTDKTDKTDGTDGTDGADGADGTDGAASTGSIALPKCPCVHNCHTQGWCYVSCIGMKAAATKWPEGISKKYLNSRGSTDCTDEELKANVDGTYTKASLFSFSVGRWHRKCEVEETAEMSLTLSVQNEYNICEGLFSRAISATKKVLGVSLLSIEVEETVEAERAGRAGRGGRAGRTGRAGRAGRGCDRGGWRKKKKAGEHCLDVRVSQHESEKRTSIERRRKRTPTRTA